MARGINKVILVGNLGRDPEMRYTQSGAAVANLAVATSESWKDKQTGEQQERTEWHRVVMFNRLGEIAGEYLKKDPRSISKAKYKPGSGRTITARIAIRPKSSAMKCRCWIVVAAAVWATSISPNRLRFNLRNKMLRRNRVVSRSKNLVRLTTSTTIFRSRGC